MKQSQPKTTYLKDYEVPPFLIDETHLRVEIAEDVTCVHATLKLHRNPLGSQQQGLTLDGGDNLVTKAVRLDGRQLGSNEYSLAPGQLRIHDLPDSCQISTSVAIKPQDNTTLQGLYKSAGIYSTQCAAQGFRNITWYLDRPDVMSKFTTTVVADKQAYPVLLSNGNDIDRGEDGSRHWVTWQDPHRKPAYLFALVAGDLQHLEDEFITMNGRKVTLRFFAQAHNLDKLGYAMNSLKRAMRWDEQAYGREYDLDIYMIVAVEHFNFGAMENKGLNIFNTARILARPDTTTDADYQRVQAVVAHEYCHNWSGNRVTCRDWFQMSLKEGFTVLRQQQFSAAMDSSAACRVNDVAVLRSIQFPEDAGPTAHPVRPDTCIEVKNFYTPTIYEKGAEVVRMIRTLLGKERFRQGADLYFSRHDGQAVTTEDFVAAMEDASGLDLQQFRRWYSQAGTPRLKVSGHYDESQQTFTLDVAQSCPPTPKQPDKKAYHLPICLGLLSKDGQDIRFSTEGLDLASVDASDSSYSAVLNLREKSQQFVFTGITEKPVPSLLRGFSAPVKLDYDYSRDELTFLMNHDSDGFNRWEASQRLAAEVILELVAQLESGAEPKLDDRLVQAFEANLNQALNRDQDPTLDKAMLALMLALPTEGWLAELTEVANVDAIHQARELVKSRLAAQLSGLFLSIYKLNQATEDYQAETGQIARRSLKNAALAYLMQSDSADMVPLCLEQFESANNMTDTSAALRALVGCAAPAAEAAKDKALASFYHRWSDEALVIDQWFSIQASNHLPGTLDRVKSLLSHDAFDIKVPNRVRALVAAFAGQNIVNFHLKSGEGYQFLADRVIELNSINPQVAARILAPLTRWRKYDAHRQALMKAQLSRILATDNLSQDVYEIASKSL